MALQGIGIRVIHGERRVPDFFLEGQLKLDPSLGI